MFDSTPDHYPLDIRSTHSPFTILWQPKMCQEQNWDWLRPLPCRIVLKRECIICIVPKPVWVHSKPSLWIVIIFAKYCDRHLGRIQIVSKWNASPYAATQYLILSFALAIPRHCLLYLVVHLLIFVSFPWAHRADLDWNLICHVCCHHPYN